MALRAPRPVTVASARACDPAGDLACDPACDRLSGRSGQVRRAAAGKSVRTLKCREGAGDWGHRTIADRDAFEPRCSDRAQAA